MHNSQIEGNPKTKWSVALSTWFSKQRVIHGTRSHQRWGDSTGWYLAWFNFVGKQAWDAQMGRSEHDNGKGMYRHYKCDCAEKRGNPAIICNLVRGAIDVVLDLYSFCSPIDIQKPSYPTQ